MYNEFDDIPKEYSKMGKFGMLCWYVESEKNILQEGLVKTHPFSFVLSMLNRKYSNIISHIQSDPFGEKLGSNNTSGISLYIYKKDFNDSIVEKIKKDIDVYGYFIAFIKPYNDEEIGLFIEPKFPFKIDSKYLKNKKLFHITNVNFLKKIKKIGLTPKESKTTFNHPDNRIYLIISKDTKFVNDFKITLAKNKDWNINDVIILEINPQNLDFYVDPNFNNDEIESNIAVFTLKNIPPKSIINIL